jgi:RNA polymerase sigma factor (sigma-70 family)
MLNDLREKLERGPAHIVLIDITRCELWTDRERAAQGEAFQRLLNEASAWCAPSREDHHAGEAQGEEDTRQYGDVDGFPFEEALCVPLVDFDTFYEEHRPRLVALVRKVVLEHWHDITIDPEDVVQDTMELAVREWPRIGRMTSPDGYLRRVAAKRAMRAMKKSAREVSTSTEGFLAHYDWLLMSARSPDEMGAVDLVSEVLSTLPHRQAQVLLLTADGWSDSHIGAKLDITPATVRSHRRHVKNLFTQRLASDRWQRLLGIKDED